MSKKTLDTEILIMRKVLAYSTNNEVIPALRCLTADGQGGTYWATPAALGGIPAFNNININSSNISAAVPFTTLSVTTTNGIGVSASNTGFTLTGQAFTQFDVSGTTSLYAFSNNTPNPSVRFIGGTGVQLATDSVNNWITIQAEPSSIGGGIYTFNNIAVVENLANPVLTGVVTTTGVNQTLSTIGSNDILISAIPGYNQLFFGISSFRSEEYLAMSTLANYGFGSSLSSVSSLFTDRVLFSLSTQDTVNLISNISIGIRTQFDNTNQQLSLKLATSLFQNFSNSYGTVTSTLKGATVSTFSFTSSLGLTGGTGTIAGPPILDTLFVSTHSFNISSMSSLFLKGGQTTFQFSPAFLTGATNQGATFPLLPISTFLVACNSVISSTTFTRPWLPANTTGNSNLYTDTVSMTIYPQELRNSYTSTYIICHRLLNYKHNFNYPGAGFLTSTLSNATSPTNALHIQINGSVFNA